MLDAEGVETARHSRWDLFEMGTKAAEGGMTMRWPDRQGNCFETTARYYWGSCRLGDAVASACDSCRHNPPQNGRASALSSNSSRTA